jgi:quinoprotein glucose dehydrogenase
MSRSAPALPAAAALAVLALATLLAPASPLGAQSAPSPGEWTAYGRDAGGTRYSPLDGIHAGNVGDLEIAWIYRTGDLHPERGRFQSTPLVVEGRLYVTSPLGRVSAVDPESGRELWTHDPRIDLSGSYGDFANRGAAYWRGPEGEPAGRGLESAGRGGAGEASSVCASRVFIATIDARLIALDAATGTPCAGFGRDGEVDLTEGLRNPPNHLGEYQVTSPPAVIGDRVIVGSAIADNQRVDAPSGAVRAFDAVSGHLLWSWDPVPQDPADPAYATWIGPEAHRTGAANAWAPLSADPELGLVFVPTSSPSPDFYGGERLGRNEYANSLVALDAATGQVRWHFQVVRHDLWDYDIPAQPVLFPFRGEEAGAARGPGAAESLRGAPGGSVPAVAVATKMGHLFVLDRRTGEPLLPVEERPVPASTVPGEEAWPTQPFPVRPAPLTLQSLDLDGPLGASEGDARWCRERLAGLRIEGPFTPPSLEGTLVLPGNIGGMQWGGVAVDPIRGIGVAPVNRLPFVVTLVPREELAAHRADAPGLELAPQRGTPYALRREVLMAPSGVPCAPPPWGSLVAVDLNAGKRLWEVPLGPFGMPAMGGAVVTGGGLVFMAGTSDRTLRAFDSASGEVLWEGALPADALSTPMTFLAGGRQYVVVAAGGHDRLRAFSGAALSDHLVAFALPAPGGEGGVPSGDQAARTDRGGAAPTASPLAGAWSGEVRSGSDRLAGTLEVPEGRRSTDAILALPEVDLRAELRVVPATGPGGFPRSGPAFTLEGTFRADDGTCAGPLRLDAELANHGALLVGLFHIEGPCLEGRSARGAFSFRRDR